MRRLRTKSIEEIRAELARIASAGVLARFDRALVAGNRIVAIKLAREAGVALYD